MKIVVLVLMIALSVLSSGLAYADSDDVKWIARCLEDNKDAKVPAEVIQKYCACMNNKMDANETRSITEWEKTHPQERADCDKEAGWR